jgi:hypothetical protein
MICEINERRRFKVIIGMIDDNEIMLNLFFLPGLPINLL